MRYLLVSIGSRECHAPMDGLGLFGLADGMELCTQRALYLVVLRNQVDQLNPPSL
jgi:hypothetical protein